MINSKKDLLKNFSFWYCEYLLRNPEFASDMENFHQLIEPLFGDDTKWMLVFTVRYCMRFFNELSNNSTEFNADPFKYFLNNYKHDDYPKVLEYLLILSELHMTAVEKYGGFYYYNDSQTSENLLQSVLNNKSKMILKSEAQLKLMLLIRSYGGWDVYRSIYNEENIFSNLAINKIKPIPLLKDVRQENVIGQTFQQEDVRISSLVNVALNCWRKCFANSVAWITNDQIKPIEKYELDSVYDLLFMGRRLVEADIARSVGIWLWDKMQKYDDTNENLFLKVHAQLVDILNKHTGPSRRYLISTNAREIYEITDECIKTKKLLHVVNKKS